MSTAESYYKIDPGSKMVTFAAEFSYPRENRFRDGAGYYYEVPLPKLNVDLLEECWRFAKDSPMRGGRTRQMINIELPNGKVVPTRVSWYQGNWSRVREFKRLFTRKRDERGRFAQGEEEFKCGTSFCIAGYAAQITHNINWSKLEKDFQPRLKELIQTPEGEIRVNTTNWHEGGSVLLGLTYQESVKLFDGNNHLSDVKRVMLDIAQARDQYIYLPD